MKLTSLPGKDIGADLQFQDLEPVGLNSFQGKDIGADLQFQDLEPIGLNSFQGKDIGANLQYESQEPMKVNSLPRYCSKPSVSGLEPIGLINSFPGKIIEPENCLYFKCLT